MKVILLKLKAWGAAIVVLVMGLLAAFAYREKAKRMKVERDQAEASTKAQIDANQAINEGAKREKDIRNSDDSDMSHFTK